MDSNMFSGREKAETRVLPMMPIRDVVIFPYMMTPFVVGRESSIHALEEALAALQRAQSADVAAKEDLLAEELRLAANALGRLTGRVDVEDILDVIFRDFCIGK